MKKIRTLYAERGLKSLSASVFLRLLKIIRRKCRLLTGFKRKRRLRAYLKGRDAVISEVNDYKMLLDCRKQGIHRRLILNRTREPLATEEMYRSIKPGDVILEAGANIGYYALLESGLTGEDGLVYAVEPARDNYYYLLKNIELNGAENVHPFKLGFGDENGEAELNIYDSENWNTFNDIHFAKKRSVETVPVRTVDSFLENRTKPDFVRMDVEGYEFEILKGMKGLMENHPPREMFIECHFNIMDKRESVGLLRLLAGYGYEVKKYFPKQSGGFSNVFMAKLERKLEQMTGLFPDAGAESGAMTIDDLIENRRNLRNGAPEVFFKLKR